MGSPFDLVEMSSAWENVSSHRSPDPPRVRAAPRGGLPMAQALVSLHAPAPHERSRHEDEEAVRRYAEKHGLTVDWVHGEANTMAVSGDAKALAAMEDELPEVLAVLGLD